MQPSPAGKGDNQRGASVQASPSERPSARGDNERVMSARRHLESPSGTEGAPVQRGDNQRGGGGGGDNQRLLAECAGLRAQLQVTGRQV